MLIARYCETQKLYFSTAFLITRCWKLAESGSLKLLVKQPIEFCRRRFQIRLYHFVNDCKPLFFLYTTFKALISILGSQEERQLCFCYAVALVKTA